MKLLIGSDKIFKVDFSRDTLIVDDGPVIDSLTIPPGRKVTRLDLRKHHLNPLEGMNYKRARDFISILDAIYPEGLNTLTRKNSNFVLLNALMSGETHLDKLIHPDNADPAAIDAYQKIETLLVSPVLRAVFCKPTNFTQRVVLAKLDRALIGDFDAFAIASFLVSQFKGHVVIPDFGFYGRDFHISLIRQHRLTAGLYSFSEVDIKLRQALLTIPRKIAYRATFEDAQLLANYAGKEPHTMGHGDFIEEAME